MLDPEVAEFYKEKIEKKAFDPPSLNYKDMRAGADLVFNDEKEIIPIYKSEDRTIEMPPVDREEMSAMLSKAKVLRRYADPILKDRVEPLDIRIYTPGEGTGFPVMIYFHGGGFIMHNIASHDALCRKLATELSCVVVSVAYRLAPENRYPAAIADAFAALRWVKENAESINGDPNRIMVSGDSSGAAISAAVSRFTTVVGGPKISAQVLFYGTYGAVKDNVSESVKKYATGEYVLSRKMLDYCGELYKPLGRAAIDLERDPFLNPGVKDLPEDMPYTINVTAECDPLHDDGAAYTKELKISGNKVDAIEGEGMMHGFMLYWYQFSKAEKIISQIALLLDKKGLWGPLD